MNIYGKVTKDTILKIHEKYGISVPHVTYKINLSHEYLKLQEKFQIITNQIVKTEFWTVSTLDYNNAKEKYNNHSNIFHDELISFDQWVEWYEKYK